MSRGDISAALNVILTDCPYGEGVDEAKVSLLVLSLQGVLTVEHNDEYRLDHPQFNESC